MVNDSEKLCKDCGYDMRGLPLRSACPECGSDGITTTTSSFSVSDSKLMRIIDSNLAVQGLKPVPDVRVRISFWAKLAWFITIVVMGLVLTHAFGALPTAAYQLLLCICSLVWPFIVYGLTPGNVKASMPNIYSTVRSLVHLSQWFWVVGYIMLFLLYIPTSEGTIVDPVHSSTVLFVCHLFAGGGLALLAFWLSDFAKRLDLDSTAKKCSIFGVTACTLGLFVFLMPLTMHEVQSATGVSMLMYWYIAFFVVPWVYAMWLFAQALHDFSSTSKWSLKYEQDIEGRQERVRAKWDSYEEERRIQHEEDNRF